MNFFNILIQVIIAICLASTAGASLCSDKNTSYSCLFNNFDRLYKTDYERFWEIVHSKELEASKCTQENQTIEFLNFVSIKTENIEFIEYLSQALEKLLLNNHKCFFNAALKLTPKTRKLLIIKLKYPLFHDQKEIDEIFNQAMKDKKYKQLSKQYFKIKVKN